LKPWLLNILACPIDKHHPLEAYFFRWETTESDIKKLAAESGHPAKELEEKYKVLRKQLSDGTISPPSIDAVVDETGNKETAALLKTTQQVLKGKVESQADLDRLHRYLSSLELAEGLLRCPECGRWYPIGNNVESIPELMPDELREKEKELTWLEKWRSLAPIAVLSGGKPFSP